MARSDLLINLVKAGASGDSKTLRRTVDAIVAEERAKQHNVLADRLQKAVESSLMNSPLNFTRPAPEYPSKTGKEFIADIVPRRKLSELILPDVTLLAVEQLIEEQQRASLLRAHSLEPRHRLLLVGPPGNGKTTLAEAIAESLAVPFLVVRYEAMIGSFLGETAARMKRVFDYARTTPCVLFFDEFDAVGKERADTHETGEIKRVVTSLLMQVDDLPSYVVVVAATNHAELLDRAVWRRFQLRLTLPGPTTKQISKFIELLSYNAKIDLGINSNVIVKSLGKISYAEAEEFFSDVLRRVVLNSGELDTSSIVREQMKLWSMRAKTNVGQSGGIDDGGTSTS
jgi:SpoVK/Ycf46/Vps4 family AAA+-type ATPase